jgi:uncharacterized membrane protein YfcA
MTLYLFLGLVTGTILALTGAGGGILAVPLLVFGAHMSMAQAGPIGLLAVGMAAGLGAVLGLRKRIVRYRAALLVSGAGMLLSPVGLWLAARVDNRSLTILFSIVLAVVSWRGFRQAGIGAHANAGQRHPPCLRDAASGRFIWTTPCARALAFAGGVAGLLSGLLGVGGGFVMVPALRRFTDLGMESVVATSLAVIALVSASGVVSSIAAGRLAWAAAIPFCAGALAGMAGGRMVAARIGGAHVQRAFAAVAALVAVGMVARVALSLPA